MDKGSARSLPAGTKADRKNLTDTLHAKSEAAFFRNELEGAKQGVPTSFSFGATHLGAEVSTGMARALEMLHAPLLEELQEARRECLESCWQGAPDVTLLARHLRRFGPVLFLTEEGEANDLFTVWLRLWREATLGDQGARRKYKQLWKALGAIGGGAPVSLSPDQREQGKKQHDLNSQHARRSQMYLNRALVRWEEKKRELRLRHVVDIQIHRQAAMHIADDLLSRNTLAMQEANRLFQQEVRRDLRKSVRNNSTRIPY